MWSFLLSRGLEDKLMKRFNSLKNTSEFNEVYKNGKSYANKYLVMYVLKKENPNGKCRIGISVSKKVGNSVVRHRLTRLVRESYRLNECRFNSSLNMVIVLRNSAKDKTFHEIQSAFLHLCEKHKILREMEQL